MALLVRGGVVLDASGSRFHAADVLIEDDRITGVGLALPCPRDVEVVEATNCCVLPGLVNAHTHAHHNLLKGLAQNWTLEDLLNHFGALNANRTVEDHYLAAALGAVEMLKTGCTAAYDLCMAMPALTEETVEAVVRAYADVGLRAVVAPMIADDLFYRTIPGLLDLLPAQIRKSIEAVAVAPTDAMLKLAETAIRKWDGSSGGRIKIGVAPSIPNQCSDSLLAGCGRLSTEYGVGVHTHLLETKVQAVSALRRWGRTMVSKLCDLGLVSPRFVGAHAVWLTDEEIRKLAEAGATVAHNPASNLRLGSGIAAAREMLDRGLTLALGTDGSMSSDNQNMFEAMRFAALVSTVRFPYRQARWLDAQSVWNMATMGSARALGMERDIGAVTPGRKADLVLLRAESVFLNPLNHALNALVYAETAAQVTGVIVDGRMVVHNGRVLTVDEARLRAAAQEAAERVPRDNAAAWRFASELAPYIATACQAVIATPYPVNRYAVAV